MEELSSSLTCEYIANTLGDCRMIAPTDVFPGRIGSDVGDAPSMSAILKFSSTRGVSERSSISNSGTIRTLSLEASADNWRKEFWTGFDSFATVSNICAAQSIKIGE